MEHSSRFAIGKQSSLAPEREDGEGHPDAAQLPVEIGSGIRLMFLANERDLDGIREAVGSGADVNFKDIDARTALHVAACQGFADVAALLLSIGAEVGPEDRWGSTVCVGSILPSYPLFLWKNTSGDYREKGSFLYSLTLPFTFSGERNRDFI